MASSTNTNFVPAIAPENGCALLALEDIRSLAPAVRFAGHNEGSNGPDSWIRSCTWRAGDSFVSLSLTGALTKEATRTVLRSPGADRGQRVELTGIADAAAYYAIPDIGYCGVEANLRSYSLDISTLDVLPLPAADAFIPLVKKALSKLR
ncbi:MAG TPA: hypothetical protein VHB79_37160 [Polyangiaceae bacterium]|nr:hypothetical protein [Polyangiaceae bacterium]